jgi:hypothetical protein
MQCHRCKKEFPESQLKSLNRRALTLLMGLLIVGTIECSSGTPGNFANDESAKMYCARCLRSQKLFLIFLLIGMTGGVLAIVLPWIRSLF